MVCKCSLPDHASHVLLGVPLCSIFYWCLQVYQNWTKDVTHLIAAQKDYKFTAHVKQQRDVVCLSWLQDCAQTGQRIAIKPHHYLHLSKKTLQEVPDVCRFGDL